MCFVFIIKSEELISYGKLIIRVNFKFTVEERHVTLNTKKRHVIVNTKNFKLDKILI